ncbi:MAG: hypothetical protein HPY59_01820 [Anaerolineae bacterium]|nr:hypothetical protein [Anaerolineae bacterium]
MPNSVFPLGTVQLVAHGSDTGGVSKFEISVNGDVNIFQSPNSSQSLVIFTHDWIPPMPGEYLITVRSQNNAGVWSAPASTVAIITGEPALQPSARLSGLVFEDQNSNGRLDVGEPPLANTLVTLSDCLEAQTFLTSSDGAFLFENQYPPNPCKLEVDKPGYQFSGSLPEMAYPLLLSFSGDSDTEIQVLMAPLPTAIPEATVAITPTASPARVTVTGYSTSVVYTYGSGCSPKDVTIQVNAIDPVGISVVVLFFRISGVNGITPWASRAMNPQGNDFYRATVNPEMEFGSDVLANLGDGWFQYQVVIQNANGDTQTRTSLLSDIVATGCGGLVPPPGSGATPTITLRQLPTPRPTFVIK